MLKTCTGDSSGELNTWLLSIEKVSKLTSNDPKDTCFTKAVGNFLKFLYSLPLHKLSWKFLKEKMHGDFAKRATTIYASLALINCKQQLDESLTAFIIRFSGTTL